MRGPGTTAPGAGGLRRRGVATIVLLAAAILLTAPRATAQFEGAVKMKTTSYDGADSSVILPTAWFSGGLFAARIDEPDGAGTRPGRFVLRADRGVMWIIIDPERKFIEIPVPEPSVDSVRPRKTYTLTATGKKDVVIGYPCGEWIADEGGGVTSRIWATAELGDLYRGIVRWFDGMSLENASDGTRWEREMAEKNLFPLLVVRSEEGEVVEREEVLSVEEGRVPSGTFDEPAGYEKQTVDPDFDKMFEKMIQEREDGPDSSRGGAR